MGTERKRRGFEKIELCKRQRGVTGVLVEEEEQEVLERSGALWLNR